MTNAERQLLSANKTLVEKNRALEADLRVLVSYIKGCNYQKEKVDEIINYYTRTRREND
jgi:hypothetical protein